VALDSGSIYDSNRYSLMGLLNRLGLDVLDCGIIQDDPLALKSRLFKSSINGGCDHFLGWGLGW
jgi:molybdopterin molybdotransferase